MAQFRTKARAVELLGKGQIADLPTAISELWKNGYDAYARELGCNLYLPGYKDADSPLFTLSDTGFGMSLNDILNKWIVLGTDSKARGISYLTDEERFGLPIRTPMGEKGIGRLSVAYLGSPMLMLTKKAEHKCQLLFIDWRILENYNLFVDDVNIPLKEFSTLEEFDSIFTEMKLEFLSNLQNEEMWVEQSEQRNTILSDVQSLYVPQVVKDEILPSFYKNEYHGTTFVIFRPNEQLLELAEFTPTEESDSALEIRRSLSGIFNIFVGTPDFTTFFNINNSSGKYNIINDFFDHKDFDIADHYIKGSFDENGMFVGTVRVYKQTFPYTFRPIRLPGKTPYGSFSLELGTIEGRQKYSLLSSEEFQQMNDKTEKFGGLYIYRDNFRVLPYGRTDYDFLKFEERRSRKAGAYFFSHRNMFGYIGIGRKENKSLIDKAGREGLIENKAYREFKKDLISFFVDVANSFFKSVEEGDDDNAHSEQMKEIAKKNERILEAERKKNKQTKAKFNTDLKNYQTQISQLQNDIDILCQELSKKAEDLTISYEQYNNLSQLLDKKKSALRQLKLIKPQRIKLTSLQEQKYIDYKNEYIRTDETIKYCEEEISKVRKRFDVQNLKRDYEIKYTLTLREISSLVLSYKKRFELFTDKFIKLFIEEQRTFSNLFKEDLHNAIPLLVTKEDYEKAITNILLIGENSKDQIESKFSSFINHVENLSFDIDDDVLITWYKEQQEKLEKKLEATNELAQLGISVEIIDHELNVLYSQMATSMEFLEGYAKEHSEISEQYKQFKVAFQHMESNYKMLQPLYHNTRRQRREFTGKQVLLNMKSFFASKFDSYDIAINANNQFLEYPFFTFESVIVSVFINIINNALYWLIPVENRQIQIEYKESTQEILIMNNGEKIDDRILNDIFALFYTKKKNGRGIGLYLAKKSLQSIGFDITAQNDREYNKLGGACFVIRPYEKK